VPGDLYGASPHPDPGASPSALGQDVGSENLPGNIFCSPKLIESTSFGKFWATPDDLSDEESEEA
jgi:hypothetical protein